MDHPNTQALYRYWDELRMGRDAPSRSEVDPRRISGALETMFILEALDNGQLRFRLAGTRLCEWLGMEARGCVSETIMARGHERELGDLGRRVLLEPGVGVMRVRALDGAGTDWSGEALLLPLRSELGELARIIGCVNLEGADRRRHPQPPLRLRCLGVRMLPIEIDPGQSEIGAQPVHALAGHPLSGPGGGSIGAGARGFDEPSRSFDRGAARGGRQGDAVEMRPRLTAIDGNPEAAREAPAKGRGRPNLRLVED